MQEQLITKQYHMAIVKLNFNLNTTSVRHANDIAINVSDNGQGLPEQTQSLRFGMQSIEQRVKAIDGLLDIYSKPGEGTEVNIEIKE